MLSNLGSSLIKEEVDNKKIIILDDLERSIRNNIISIDDILGVVNNYIEHNGCKVIVIAHDEIILSQLREKREKVFGQTIRIESDIDSAVTTFIDQKEIYNQFPEIKNILKNSQLQSGYSSLRVLKYIANDCDRLFSCIQEIKLNKSQLEYLFKYFIFSCIELRYEKLTFNDYIDHVNVQIKYHLEKSKNENAEKHILIKMLDKYEISTLDNELISQDSIVSIVKNGCFDEKNIIDYIKKSNFIKESPAKQSWYKLSKFDTIDGEEIDKALHELHHDFENRNFYLLGDICHMISFLLLEEKVSSSEHNFEKIEDQCKKYIDDLFFQGRLEKRNPRKSHEETDNNSYQGISYWRDKDYEEYSNRLYSYLYEKSYELFNNDVYEYNLLDKIKNNLESLISDCTQIGNNYGELCEIPFFHTIPPEEFVSTWLSLSNSQQVKISIMFRRRYAMGRLSSTLIAEKEWLHNVLLELKKSANSMKSFHKYRIERLNTRIPIM